MTPTYRPLTLLCIASHFKGLDFLQEAHHLGCTIYLITDVANREKPWPREFLADIFFVDEREDTWNIPNLIKGVSYLARSVHFDKIVPLDDYDVEKASALREHLRVSGMGETRMRYFRDKLAMRDKAEEDDILVPEYVHVLNYERIKAFTSIVTPPWILKPRFKDASDKYKKMSNQKELWDSILDLGDDQSLYLIERFIPGEIYQVDSIVYDHEVQFAGVHKYSRPVMDIVQNGGMMSLSTIKKGSKIEKDLLKLNKQIIDSMGLKYGVSSNEFIHSAQDGKFYFIQSSGKVSGHYIAELVEAANGLNLWREWAKMEMAQPQESAYQCPKPETNQARVVRIPTENPPLCSSRIQHQSIVWRQVSHNHVTVVIKAKSFEELEMIEKEVLAGL
ncbi:ATPase [bacterium]|nr:MAG: ATPase [bacterium]